MENILKDNFTKVPNEFIKGDDYNLNIKELTVITLLLQTQTNKNICIFNMRWLYDTIGVSDKNTYSQKEIKRIINSFIEDEIIILRKNIYEDSEMITDVSKVNKNDLLFAEIILDDLIDESFTIISDKEIKLILDYCKNNLIDSFGLLSTLLYILSCMNMDERLEDYLLCYPSIEKITLSIGLTEATVLKYINILKELKILIFDYAGYKVLVDGKIKNGKMFYSRYENEELLLNRLNKEREEHGFINISKRIKDKSNLKKSIKQRINTLKKKDNLTMIYQVKLNLLEEQYKKLNE